MHGITGLQSHIRKVRVISFLKLSFGSKFTSVLAPLPPVPSFIPNFYSNPHSPSNQQINLAIAFSNMIKANDRFELTHPVIMGLVCFRLKGPNELNEQLVSTINRRKKMHILSTIVSGQYIIRFAVCSRFTELYDIEIAYRELLDALEEVENPPIEESDQLNCIRN